MHQPTNQHFSADITYYYYRVVSSAGKLLVFMRIVYLKSLHLCTDMTNYYYWVVYFGELSVLRGIISLKDSTYVMI